MCEKLNKYTTVGRYVISSFSFQCPIFFYVSLDITVLQMLILRLRLYPNKPITS